MNESELEKELRSLLPTKPSVQLAERIAADLEAPAPQQPNRREPAAGLLIRPVKPGIGGRFTSPWFLALSGFTTVVIGFFAVMYWMKPDPTTEDRNSEDSAAVFALNEVPDESVAELIGAQDDGVVYDEDSEPQRQVRMVYLERHTWTNPQTGAVVEIEVPREDIVLMPVAMQ